MKTPRENRGLALFKVIFVMAFILLFITGSLVFSQLGIKSISNLKLATQALAVADAGLQHAVAVLAVGYDFDDQLDCATPPCTIVPETPFSSLPGFSYAVTARNDDTDLNTGGSATNDTNNMIILNSTAFGPGGTKKEVQAYVNRSSVSFTPPGALYLPASSANIKFKGNDFFVTGNDTDFNGSPPSTPKPAISGVAPILDSNGQPTAQDQFKTALGSSRYNLVQGSGYSPGTPATPSVTNTSNVFSVNQIALNMYNNPSTVKFLNGFKPLCPSNLSLPRPSPDPCVLGTDSSPQITYIRESIADHIHIDDYVRGTGILVIEGKAHLYGNFEFHGVVIHVSQGLTGGSDSMVPDPDELIDGVSPFSMRGNAKIFGTVLKGPTNQPQHFEMRNDSKIYYSSRALSLVNTVDWGSLVPQRARVFAWLER